MSPKKDKVMPSMRQPDVTAELVGPFGEDGQAWILTLCGHCTETTRWCEASLVKTDTQTDTAFTEKVIKIISLIKVIGRKVLQVLAILGEFPSFDVPVPPRSFSVMHHKPGELKLMGGDNREIRGEARSVGGQRGSKH